MIIGVKRNGPWFYNLRMDECRAVGYDEQVELNQLNLNFFVYF